MKDLPIRFRNRGDSLSYIGNKKSLEKSIQDVVLWYSTCYNLLKSGFKRVSDC